MKLSTVGLLAPRKGRGRAILVLQNFCIADKHSPRGEAARGWPVLHSVQITVRYVSDFGL